MIWKKDKKRKKTISDDMTPREVEKLLNHKKRVIQIWAVVAGLMALATFGFLAMTIFDHFLKGSSDGGLEINYNKVDEKLAWLGSEIRDLDATISEALYLTSTNGVLINNVTPGSPADDAGLARGDVILSFDDTDIIDSYQIQDQIRQRDPGDTVKLVVDTVDGGKRNVYVTLAAKPDDTETTDTKIKKVAGSPDTTVDPVMPTPWGISVSPLTDEVREQFDIPAAEQGVVVVTVVQGGLADSQGIEVGDVIESINRMPTPNLQSLFQALQDDENVLMDVYSPDDAKRFFVTLPDEGSSPPQVVLMSFGEEDTKTNRIIVPADTASLNGTVYYRFSSAPYFILYDLNEKKMTAIKNPYAAQIRGMGITVAQMLIDYNIDAVIVGGIGPQAYDTFYLAKVEVYGPVSGTVRTAITSYQLEKLTELKEANLGGYGNSSVATIPTGGSPWTEQDDADDGDDGLAGQPSDIPPKGKPIELTAQGDARASRPETCICPNCGTEVTHPSSTSCADMVCPLCGSKLMTASPGTDSITGTETVKRLPATDIPTTLRPIALTAGSTVAPTSPPSRVAAIPTASNLWTLSNQPATTPVQQTAATSTQVSVCVCPLDGTTVTHPIGIPCAALQCPVCGGRMVSGTSAAAGTITQTAGVRTGGKPDDVPPVQQTFYLVPVAGGPPEDVGAAPSDVGAAPSDTGRMPSDAGASSDTGGSGSPQGGRSTTCICPVDGTTVTHPIGVPCTALKCPVCGSRLVNAEPGGTSNSVVPNAGTPTAMTQVAGALTGGKPDDVPPVQQTASTLPVGGKPDDVPPLQQAFYLVPVGGKPDDVPPVQQTFYVVPVGGKPDDVPPVQQTFYLVPVSSQPDGVPLLGQSTQPITQGQKVALVPTAGGPPEDMGMAGAAGGPSDGTAVDGPAQGGGQAGSGAAQSGRSTLCVCPMCDVTVTHPIGVPCSSLTCPVCGSRLVNETPGGASGDITGSSIIPSAATATALTSNIVYVAGASNKLVIPSTGRSLKSDIAQLLDDARYFLMFGLGTYDVVPNPYYRDKRATGAEIGQFIVSEGGSVVICNNVSASALKALKDLKVRVYTGFVGTVQQALDIYNDGRLKSSSSAGLVLDDDEEEHGGGGPPASKSKSRDKGDDAEIF